MKDNKKFLFIIAMLLLVSWLILVFCMFYIAAENGGVKEYYTDGRINNLRGVIIEGDTPTAQNEMQKKFYAMYDISEDGRSITVISENFLSEFWKSNYEQEVIHSLSTEEVFFLIQDSIRIYAEYEKIILPGFAAATSDSGVEKRFPCMEEQIIDKKKIKADSGYYEDVTNIHAIILYRLFALSSPETFFTGEEAIRFVGGNPESYSGFYPETVFYIPDYSLDTDRDYILTVMGETKSYIDSEKFSDLFVVLSLGEPEIEFSSIINGSITDVFPTAEMKNEQSVFLN